MAALYEYTVCSCGAGVCWKGKETNGPNQGPYFSACPVGEKDENNRRREAEIVTAGANDNADEEASLFKAMLQKAEDQMTTLELETKEMKSHLGEIRARM